MELIMLKDLWFFEAVIVTSINELLRG
jgi:hypothetical protein